MRRRFASGPVTQRDHERLIVYHRAPGCVAPLEGVARTIPQARADLRDQLRRTSTSIVLNIAEGAGEHSGAEKRRFYRIAKRSTSETLAILDVCDTLFPSGRGATSAIRAPLDEVAAMLTALTHV